MLTFILKSCAFLPPILSCNKFYITGGIIYSSYIIIAEITKYSYHFLVRKMTSLFYTQPPLSSLPSLHYANIFASSNLFYACQIKKIKKCLHYFLIHDIMWSHQQESWRKLWKLKIIENQISNRSRRLNPKNENRNHVLIWKSKIEIENWITPLLLIWIIW